MRQSDKFLNSVEEYDDFKQSGLEYEDIYFDDQTTRTVLVAFLNRSYIPLRSDDFTDHPELSEVDTESVESSFETLKKMNLVEETDDGWILNKENKDARRLQDARIEYKLDKKY